MDTSRGTITKTGCTAALALGALFAVSACTATPAAPSTPPSAPTQTGPGSSSPTPSPSPSQAASEAAAADEAALPLPASEISDWAATAVPNADADGFQLAYRGWLSQHTTPRQSSTDNRLTPGSYQLQLACRGEGEITATFETVDGDPIADSPVQSCSNSTVAFDLTIAEQGVTPILTLDGAPTIYALSFQSVANDSP